MKQIIHSAVVTAVIAVVVALTVTIVDTSGSDRGPSTPQQSDNTPDALAAGQASSEIVEVGADPSVSTSSSTTIPLLGGPPGSETTDTTTTTTPNNPANRVREEHEQRKINLRGGFERN